jgi:hypothetical protein
MTAIIDTVRARLARGAYRRAMLRAIDAAAEPSDIWGACNRSDGLRAIRAFERLNGRPFNPHDRTCCEIVRATGPKHRRALFGRVGDECSRHPAAISSQGE